MSNVTIPIRVISNPDKLLGIENVWNNLVNKWSKNPIFSIGFVEQFMKLNRSKGWVPLVLVIFADNMLVGIAPLMMKKKFGIRFAKFLLESWLSPDFVVNNQYRESCIALTLDFLFKNLRCQLVEFTLPGESQNLRVLKQKCKDNRVVSFEIPDMGHCVIPIECTWDEFKISRGRKFRKRFKEIENRLDRAGCWKVTRVENEIEDSDVFNRILKVEKRSWKQIWRTRRGMELDQDLMTIWKGAQYTARTDPDFKWGVWFLELDEQPLAYTLVLQYEEVAFIMKTSYDERYERFSPGTYVNNAVVRELFCRRHVRNIDWLTDLPFLKIWTSICLPRVRILMTKKGVLPALMGSAIASEYARSIFNSIPYPLMEKLPFVRELNSM